VVASGGLSTIDAVADQLEGRGLLDATADHGVGEYRCACGQDYRVFVTADHVRVWPRNGASSYSRDDVVDGSCIRCGSLLPVR
jgi:hypothetical protein